MLVVGLASYLWPDAFPDKTVWSHFGSGYGFVPLVLPVLGLLWLRRTARRRADAADAGASALHRASAPASRQPSSTGSSRSTGMSRSVLVW